MRLSYPNQDFNEKCCLHLLFVLSRNTYLPQFHCVTTQIRALKENLLATKVPVHNYLIFQKSYHETKLG